MLLEIKKQTSEDTRDKFSTANPNFNALILISCLNLSLDFY